MANIVMERCSMSSAIREMKINTTMSYHFTPTNMVLIKKTGNNKCKLAVEKVEPS